MQIKTTTKIGINAKIDINVEIDTHPKINTNTKTNTNMKINTNQPIFDFPHTKKNFNWHYASLNQSIRHEDGQVESNKRCADPPLWI